MSRKVKIVKKNPEPARGTVGVNPLDPWSAKSNLAEASLDNYLLARGINPKFVSRETKISHAKSALFQKWKSDHKFEEVQHEDTESLDEDAMLDRYLSAHGINPKYAPKNLKISHSKSHKFQVWKQHHMTEEADKADTLTFDIPLMIRMLEYAREDAKTDMDLHKVVEKLISIRSKGTLTMDDYAFVTKLKEEIEFDEAATIQGTALDKFRQAAIERQKKHDEIQKTQSKSGEGMTSAIDRLQKQMNKEEIDVKDAKKILDKAFRKPQEKPVKENTLDPLAATEAPCTCGNDDAPTEKKRQLSKSARMIKALYKKHNMKEEMYDWEKDDKNQTSPGKKKPKLDKSSEESNFGSNKPQARAVMSGGKTMTNEPRDVVEIDPLLKNRPDLNGNTKDVTDKKKQ